MNTKITNTIFQKSIKHHYSVLKKGYLSEIEKATDKTYAKQHFKKVLFLDNEFLPNQSILFDGIKTAFNHFSKLNASSALKETLALIKDYKVLANQHKNNAIEYLKGNASIKLADHYLYYINANLFTLKELIQTEIMVIESSKENLVASLSLYLAGQQLFKEFNTEPTVDDISLKSKTTYKHHFTQKQQVMALYFLMKAYGVNTQIDADITTLSALYHLILGVPFKSFDKLKNTNIYKNLRSAPELYHSDAYYLKNLNVIRPYFVNTTLQKAVDLIDGQIKRCETE